MQLGFIGIGTMGIRWRAASSTSIRAFTRFWKPEVTANGTTPGAHAGMVVRTATCRSVGG